LTNKFSDSVKLQKKPPVCKKPPPEFDPSPPIFQEYPLYAFVYYSDPTVTDSPTLTGTTVLEPISVASLHFGVLKGSDYDLEIDLVYDDDTPQFLLDVQMVLGPTVVSSVSAIFDQPPAKIPWHSELQHFEDPGSSRKVRCKIWS